MLAMPNAAGHRQLGICSRCASALLASEPLCPQCGLPAQSSTLPCGRCLQKPPPWQRLVTVNDYRPPLSGLIHQLKFNKRPELAPALARLLLLRIRQRRDLPRPDRIISVPLWQRRQWKRGFNQSDSAVPTALPLAGLRLAQRCANPPAPHRHPASAQRQIAQTEPEKRLPA